MKRQTRERLRNVAHVTAALLFFATVILVALVAAAFAEQRTIYGKDGLAVGRIDTDSQGTTTLYGRDGRVITRESTTRSGTIIYDGLSGTIVGGSPAPQRKGKR